PALVLPDPTRPAAFPGNFPDEFFYFRALADLASGGATARLTLALEGSFVNGTVVAGDQVVFSRVRIRASGLVPGGVYTFTHPYGTEVLTADAGAPSINVTRDIGLVSFTRPLQGDIGPFLTFLSGPIPPPPGTIGTATGQTVTGSACNQNFFAMAGPGLPEGGVSTTLFGTLIGRIAPLCGNGTLDPGEQ